MRKVHVWHCELRTISGLEQRLRAVWRHVRIGLLLRESDLRSLMAYKKHTFVWKVVGSMLLKMLFKLLALFKGGVELVIVFNQLIKLTGWLVDNSCPSSLNSQRDDDLSLIADTFSLTSRLWPLLCSGFFYASSKIQRFSASIQRRAGYNVSFAL